jgi:hypothetical protein
MEMNHEMQALMEKIEKSNRQQVNFARIQCIFSVVAAVCCLLLLLTVAKIVPDIRELSGEISGIAAQAETVLTNLETVTEELAQADIGGLVSNVDDLTQTSQDGIRQALEKVNAINLETLNKAIEDLAKVVAPLANLVQSLSSFPFLK